MTECVLMRYSEIGLKGDNKSEFELKLIKNIKAELKKQDIRADEIKRLFSRILIITHDKPDLSCVFGVSSYSYSKIISPSIDDIKKEVLSMIKDYGKDTTFRISVKRLDKDFEMDSMAVEREIGAFVVKNTGAKVNLKVFEKEIGIDLLKNEFIIYSDKIRGRGGLPVGIEGKAIALIDDHNSIKAAILAMKRGCEIFPVGYTETSIEELSKFSPTKLSFQKFNNLQEINEYAKKIDAKAIIVGQTLTNFNNLETNLLVLRPMIGV